MSDDIRVYDDNDDDYIIDQSLTATVKAFLEGEVDGYEQPMMIAPDVDSIYSKSQAAGMTLQQYVQKNPDKAIKEAEASLQQWLEIQSSGSLEGLVQTTNGKYSINRNMAQLLKERVDYAQKMLDKVNEFAYSAFKDGERKKDHLIRTAYQRAVTRGDTRMLIYLMDRVDGRPGESKVVDLDYDNAYNVYQIIHTLFDKQLEVLNSGSGTRIICCSRRAGKSHLLSAACIIEALRIPNTTVIYIGQCWSPDTLLRKYDGSLVRADSIQVGDLMMDDNSEPQRVLSLASGSDQMYLIKSRHGDIEFECNSKHILTVRCAKNLDKYGSNWSELYELGKVYDIPLDKFMLLPLIVREAFKLYREQIQFKEQFHNIDPYWLGLWLGDGDKHSPRIFIGKDEIELLDWAVSYKNITITQRKQSGSYVNVVNFVKGDSTYNKLAKNMRDLDLICNKHIPQEYKVDSVDNRLQLLAGLIDSDGFVSNKSLYFDNSNKILVDDFIELAQSLGFGTHLYTSYRELPVKGVCTYYQVKLSGLLSTIPCKVLRKQTNDNFSIGYKDYGFSFDIIPLEEGPYSGFVLDGSGRCLLADYTVTHNTMENTEYIFEAAANKIIDKCKLRDKRGKRLNWKRLDNGSRIHICGLSNTQDPDKILGFGAKVIVVDEFFALKDNLLDYLIKEVLRPMQMDYATEYKFLCAGTPPRIKGTYGEHAWKTWEVPHFFWTYKENPFPVDPALKEKYVNDELAELGLDMTSVYARREYGGEWIYDEDLLLYPEFHTYNPREAVPNYNIDMVLFGIDYGVSDSDALIGIAWDTAGRRGYVFHEDKFSRLDIKDRTISQLQYLEGQVKHAWSKALEFFPTLGAKEANKRILWDADDNDQKVSDHFNMNIRLEAHPDIRLNIQNAHKTSKTLMFDKIRDLLRTGNLLLIQDGKTVKECEKTILKRGPNGQVYPEVDMKTFHPDLLPAMRYALWNVIGEESAPKQGEI